VARGTIETVTIQFVDSTGQTLQHSVDVEGSGIKGVARNCFLDDQDQPIDFTVIDNSLNIQELRSVMFSITYPSGALELTSPIEFTNGELGFISWSRIQLALADPNASGDALVDPPFVKTFKHFPAPQLKP
jgi:hypothetical protein